MNRFSIKDIETITGIKAHTLRIWEQRYDLLETKRSESNIRYYDSEDLRFLLNISILNDHGFKISEIAKMPKPEIAREVEVITEKQNSYSCNVNCLCKHTLSFNEREFKRTLTTCIKKTGFDQTMIQIVYPFLQKIGIMWQTGSISPAQEHFASNLIKQKLIVSIDALKVPKNPASKKFMLFLPGGEYHEIALLFAHYLIKAHGHDVLYLGQNLSLHDIKDVDQSFHPDYIFSSLISPRSDEDVCRIINLFRQHFPDKPVLLAGGTACRNKSDNSGNIVLLQEVTELLSYLNEIELKHAAEHIS